MIPKAKQNLHECSYHLEGMKRATNIEIFEICFAAFVNSARNVTFVLQKEYAHNDKFVLWYKAKQEKLKNDIICKYFVDLRNKINKEGINELNFVTTIHTINTANDLIDRPVNSKVIIKSRGLYYLIKEKSPEEDMIPAAHKGFVQTEIKFNKLPDCIKDKNVFDLSISYYEILKSIIDGWTGLLNQESNK